MNETPKLNCNIIKDLLPSYLEEICSQDTKNIVDEHLSQCSECRRLKTMLQKTEFVSEQINRSEISYIKKLKHHFIKRGFFSALILSAFILIGFTASIKNNFIPETYYAFLPILLFITRAVIPVPLLHEKVERMQKILAAISTALTGYVLFLMAVILYYLPQIEHGSDGPFHLQPEQMGPFFDSQLIIIALFQAAMYVTGLVRTLYGKSARFLCMGLYLTGGFTALMLDRFLKSFSAPSLIFQTMVAPVMILLFEGACTIFLLTAVEKIRHSHP